jgi:hypothetical protein
VTRSAFRAFVGCHACLVATGCIETLGSRIELPLELAGSAASEPFAGQGGWTIELTRAELAFGPLYLCGGAQAGSLCDTARLEWLGSAVIDALNPEPQAAGQLEGETGFVRSFMYDLGITSLLTLQEPLPLDAAIALGGNSVRLEGVARATEDLPFLFEIAIQQQEQTEIGVSVVRQSGAEGFEHDVSRRDAGLIVRFDPRPWLQSVDFQGALESGAAFAPGTQGYRAVNGAIVAGARPSFEWLRAE